MVKTHNTFNFRRGALWAGMGLALAVLLVLVLGKFVGLQHVLAQVAEAPLAAWLTLLAGTLTMNALRFSRWAYAAHALGMRVPVVRQAVYYVAGMALLPTPGKVGTALRLYLLHRNHRVAYHTSAPLMLMDALTDLASLLLLIAITLPLLVPQSAAVLGMLALLGLAGAAMVSQNKTLPRRMVKTVYHLTGRRRARLFAKLLTLMRRATRLLRPGVLLPLLALGTAGWLALALACAGALALMGAEVGLVGATFALSGSVLAGVATLLPAGVGGAEAGLFGTFVWLEVAAPTAVAATALIRLATIWLPVALGWLVLPVALKKPNKR